MDKKWRSTKRDGSNPYKKSRGYNTRSNYRTPSRVDYDNTSAEDLAEYVLTALARDPSFIQVKRESLDEGHVLVSVTSNSALTGRLIGRGGKTISALRLLVRSVANEHGKRVDVEVASSSESED